MKKILFVSLIFAFFVTTSISQLPVTDVGSQGLISAQTVQQAANWAEELTKWAEQLKGMMDQLTTLKQNLQTAQQQLQTVTDMKMAQGLASAVNIDTGLIQGQLSSSGLNNSLADLSKLGEQIQGASDFISKVYKPVDTDNPQESVNQEDKEPFLKYEMVEKAFSNYEKVTQATSTQSDALKKEIAKLQSQLQSAPDDATVQKIKGSLQGAEAALIALESQNTKAAEQVKIIHMLNENNEKKQKEAEDLANQKTLAEMDKKADQAIKDQLDNLRKK